MRTTIPLILILASLDGTLAHAISIPLPPPTVLRALGTAGRLARCTSLIMAPMCVNDLIWVHQRLRETMNPDTHCVIAVQLALWERNCRLATERLSMLPDADPEDRPSLRGPLLWVHMDIYDMNRALNALTAGSPDGRACREGERPGEPGTNQARTCLRNLRQEFRRITGRDIE